MPLSAGVTRELRKELASLRASRAAADEMIGALETLLEPQNSVGAIAAATPGASRAQRPSLRADVLAALGRRSPRGAAEITADLKSRGVRVGGATQLRDRVSHELSRLRRKGVLQRLEAGGYQLSTVHARHALDEAYSDAVQVVSRA